MENSWKLSDLYTKQDFYNDLDIQIKLFEKSDLPNLTISNLFNIFSFLNSWSCKIDDLYTFSLLHDEIGSSLPNEILHKIDKLFSCFETKTLSIAEWIDKNQIEIKKEIYSNKKLEVFKTYLLKLLDDMNTNELTSYYERIHPIQTFEQWYYSHTSFGQVFLPSLNKQIEITNENLLILLQLPCQEDRHIVYDRIDLFLRELSNRAGELLNLNTQSLNLIAFQGGHKNYFEKVLSESYFNLQKSFENVINNASNLNKNITSKKKTLLGLSKISFGDMYAYDTKEQPLVSIEQAKTIIKSSFSKLGNPIISKLVNEQIFNDHWIDWMVSEKKRPGGRSFSYFNHHPYILVNWQGTLDNLYALIHEIGGAISQSIASDNNIFVNSELSHMKVEILSFLSQITLSKYLIDYDVSKFKSETIKGKAIDDIKDNLTIPSMLAQIEYKLAKVATSQALDSDIISSIYSDISLSFHDIPDFINTDLNRFNWVRNEHLYYNGYNTKYIEAYCIANYIDEFNLLDEYINLLKKGERLTDKEFLTHLNIPKDFQILWNITYNRIKSTLK